MEIGQDILAVLQHDHRRYHLAQRLVRYSDHGDIRHSGFTADHALDGQRRDLASAHVDDVLGPVYEVDVAAAVHVADVASRDPVRLAPGAEGRVTARRQVGPRYRLDVPDLDLADLVRGARSLLADDPYLGSLHRPAEGVGRAGPPNVLDLGPAGLGERVLIHDLGMGSRLLEPTQNFGRAERGTHRDLPDPGKPGRVRRTQAREHPGHNRREPQRVDTVSAYRGPKRFRAEVGQGHHQ